LAEPATSSRQVRVVEISETKELSQRTAGVGEWIEYAVRESPKTTLDTPTH